MNKKVLAVVGAVLVLATGCVNTYAPSATMAWAFKAIQQGDLETFRETLSPEFAKTFGNEASLQKLRAEFAQYSSVQLGDETLLSHEHGPQGHGYFGDTVRVYSEQIVGKGADSKLKLLYTATVTCSVMVTVRPNPGTVDGSPELVVESQNCLISDLK